jgi:hypothetical protein
VPPSSALGRSVPRPQVDPEGEDSVRHVGLGVTEHGVVHKVDLHLLLEPQTLGAFDGREAAGPDGIRPGLEPVDHRLRVESLGHLPIVQAVLRDTTTRVPHYTEEEL